MKTPPCLKFFHRLLEQPASPFVSSLIRCCAISPDSTGFARLGARYLRRFPLLGLEFFCYGILSGILVGCPATPVMKPMDVENPQWDFDDNLFSINPTWSYMLTNGTPPDPTKVCPVDSDDVEKWTDPNGTCTSQGIYLNQATGWNQFDCWLHGRAIQAHINWFPVVYQGSLYWDSHSRPGGDDDYNFSVCRSDNALYTANKDSIHTEFDSDETVDQWDNTNTWWESFHHAVDDDDNTAHGMLNGNFAIVIALLGLDGGHADFKSELHPVYGMFIHIKDDQTDDQWAFFIRNWGNEGSCSNNQEYINYPTLFVELPHQSAEDVNLTSSNIWGINFEDQDTPNVSYQKSPGGVLFAFRLGNPRDKKSYVGDLHLKWSGAQVQRQYDYRLVTIPPRPSATETEGVPKALLDQLDRLPADSKRQLFHQLSATEGWRTSKVAVRPNGNIAGFDPSKLTKDIAEMKRKKKMPNYRSLILSEIDPTIYIQKKRKLDLITRFVHEHSGVSGTGNVDRH
jgi:hypothetical protein